MSEKNRATSAAFRYLGKKLIARLARRGFDRDFLLGRERTHVCGSHFKIDIALRGQFFHKTRVSITRAAAKLMIEMTNDQFSVAALVQPMEERDRIASA